MPTIELFPFRYRDPRTGKWIRARYLAELSEIQRRYSEWELIGLCTRTPSRPCARLRMQPSPQSHWPR